MVVVTLPWAETDRGGVNWDGLGRSERHFVARDVPNDGFAGLVDDIAAVDYRWPLQIYLEW